MKTRVIMLAGGRGERMKSEKNKILLSVGGIPAIIRSISAFIPFSDEMIIVSRPEDQDCIGNEIRKSGLSFSFRFADGGQTRQQSVLNGLNALDAPDPEDMILIHDAARCLVKADLIERIISSVKDQGTGIPGIPATSTYKICSPDGLVQSTPDRSGLYEIQTPQGFLADLIIPLSVKASEEGIVCTDDAGILEHFHVPVKIVRGDASNIKLTEPEDLIRARNILKGDKFMRVGMGYDVHRLVPDRKLILCGTEIPFELGLLGHSDADVALHALMDAMLGACALGDIGKYFPDSDDRYRGISSLVLLKETVRILLEHGYEIYNADITIAAQKPKLLPFVPEMIKKTAEALQLPQDRISIKATTTEKLGFEGRMEGISSYAVCTVTETEKD